MGVRSERTWVRFRLVHTFFFQIFFFIRALRISLYLAMCILLYNRVYILVLPHFDRDIGDYKREVVYYLRTSFLALVLLYIDRILFAPALAAAMAKATVGVRVWTAPVT